MCAAVPLRRNLGVEELLVRATRIPFAAYREDRPHGDFVRGLGAALPDRTAFVDALGDAVGRRMALEPVGVEAAEAALAREHRRVTTLVDLGPSTCGLSI